MFLGQSTDRTQISPGFFITPLGELSIAFATLKCSPVACGAFLRHSPFLSRRARIEWNMNEKQAPEETWAIADETKVGSDNHAKPETQRDDDQRLDGHEEQLPTRLYKRRWMIVLLFSSYSLCSSFQWIQYGSINNIVTKFYGVETFTIDWMSMIYMLTYIPLVFPATWLLDRKGLRIIALVATALNCIGSWIKVVSVRRDLFPVTFLGQFFASLANAFILGMPSGIASVWFGSNEVSTACSVGVFGNQVGKCKAPWPR